MISFIDHHGGREIAGTDTLNCGQGKKTICAGITFVNPESGLQVVQQIIGAAQHTGHIGADLEMIFADVFILIQGVETGQFKYPDLRYV